MRLTKARADRRFFGLAGMSNNEHGGSLPHRQALTSLKELRSFSERCQALLQRFMRLPLGRDPSAAEPDA